MYKITNSCFKIVFLFSNFATLSCASNPRTKDLVKRQQIHMGTVIEIQLDKQNLSLSEEGFLEFARLDEALSVYKPESEISRLNSGQVVSLSPSTRQILELSRQLAEDTGGYFDPTLGSLTQEAYGFQNRSPQKPSEQILTRARQQSGWAKLQLKGDPLQLPKGLKLDLGGIGKGFAVDRVRKIFDSHPINKGLIAASGDIFCYHPCFLAVRQTKGESALILGQGNLKSANIAISTSGRDVRANTKGDVHHLISPKSGKPVSHWRSLTLISPFLNNALLDAWTTALFVMPEDEALLALSGMDEVQFLVQKSDEKLIVSQDWFAQFRDWTWNVDLNDSSIMTVQQKKKN